ncbi:hypothetical protein JXA02_04625 [candidate division KSB1 bacterium]|nr:hypothetical protein [candidate division KSB1 bacterium]RQW08787.1 MAG: hypothetical protein EH222_05245 [candidate division KSB1 bacterium]
MRKLKFNWRDVIAAPRLALSLQRMWIQLIGLAAGYIVYVALSYLGLVLAGHDLKLASSQFGLLPCVFTMGDRLPWFSWLLTGIGTLFLFLAHLVTSTAVARAVYMTMKGNSFYTWRQAFKFSFRKIFSIVFTPLALIILVGLVVLGALVIGLLGKIPFVGEIGVSLFTVIWLLGSLLIFFLTLVTAVAILLVPSILATTDEDAFEAIFQAFSIAWSQPWRFLFYQGVVVLLSFFALGVLAFFIKESVMIMNALLSAFMGADYANLANNGQALLQSWTLPMQNTIESIYREFADLVFFRRQFVSIPAADLSASVILSAYFYAASLLFIGGWVISYGISTFTAGTTLSFLVLKYRKDEENLLERQDLEEESEESDDADTVTEPEGEEQHEEG